MAGIDTTSSGFEIPAARSGLAQSPLFAATVFTSALLVFFVQPMVGKLLLPLLGGAPAVWNTAMAFFQVALLAGYGYAHLLQRYATFRWQVIVHGIVLVLAGLSLPLHVSGVLGSPSPQHPVLWMLGVLTLSIGAPFAALSATAPLVQAWFARAARPDATTGQPPEPYALYAASNLGSLLSLVAYPVLVEPLTHLTTQRLGWSAGYVVLAIMIVTLGLLQASRARPVAAHEKGASPSLVKMALWIGLAAVPSSLMMGVTTYLSTDVASAPFLWVIPLALYLVTFILAFASKPAIRPGVILIGQAGGVCLCIYVMCFHNIDITLQLTVHLFCFFLTALMCHSALAAARPEPGQLTLYYFCMSLGGVVGGSFNAFLAPVLFSTVLEYPLVLALACLVRPWGRGTPLTQREKIWLGFGMLDVAGLIVLVLLPYDNSVIQSLSTFLFAATLVTAFALRNRGLYMAVLIGLAAFAVQQAGQSGNQIVTERSFFGVVRLAETEDPLLGRVRRMTHGTTLHGAQALAKGRECQPLTYYAPATAIGQTITALQARSSKLDMAVVGLGVGTMSSYVRKGDRMAFYEIDPTVVRMATNPAYFTFISKCAQAPVSFHTGDARLTLAPLPAGQLDMLTVDAFSSDAVPAHLLTAEAIRMYLSKLKGDGVLLLHLSNRHLELRDPVIAAITKAGGVSLTQVSIKADQDSISQTASVVVIAARTEAGLKPFRADPRWTVRDPGKVKAWTDDYMNLIGAMLNHKTVTATRAP